jgi:dTDP-4-dehydrorhamnose reductase
LTRKNTLEKVIKDDTSAVINCAAYTNVDTAESDYNKAYAVNALGPEYLAQICNDKDIELVHISTDYVFDGEAILEDGEARAYIETDECAPGTVYGKTKLAGEDAVRKYHDKYYILRSAWLYGYGNNFVRTMLNLSKNKDKIKVVNDQTGSPTSTPQLAHAIVSLLGSGQYGIYHATCEGRCTWYEFAKKIFEIVKKDVEIVPILSDEFICAAQRPKWSVLENKALKEVGKNDFSDWQQALIEYLKDN